LSCRSTKSADVEEWSGLVASTPSTFGERLAPVRERNFAIFLSGYAASALGSSMATVGLAFAILQDSGSITHLSYVLAARIVPMVVFLLGAGVIGDRLSRRTVMLYSDLLRTGTQAGLAVLFVVGHPPLWPLLLLAALGGLGEAIFRPSFDGLVPLLVSREHLQEANVLVGLTLSIGSVAGPALAGLLVAVTSPAVVLFIDAGTYLLSVVSLLLLRISWTRPAAATSLLHDLQDGWTLFWNHTWLWTVTLQFTFFNLIVWAPYLVLGPSLADRSYGGAGNWGLVLGLYGAGSVVGGLLLIGRRPRRPLVVTTVITFLWAAPSAALAARAPLWLVGAAAAVAGIAMAVFEGLWMTVIHQRIPTESISRVMSFVSFGAYSIGPIGLALAGPIAEWTSISAVLAAGVAWQIVANSVVLAQPAIRRLQGEGPPPVDVHCEVQENIPDIEASSAPSADPPVRRRKW
jgi:MFS family permease